MVSSPDSGCSNRPSTRASVAPSRTSPASARPPTRSSTASTRSVLPAPVSPVMAVSPGPSTRLRSATIPRSTTCSSTSIPPLPVGEAEFGLQDLVEVAGTERDDARGAGAAPARDGVAGGELAQLAAVGREDHAAVVAHGEAQHLFGGEHQRAVEEHVRRDRSEEQTAVSRRHDGAACRERVRGGAGGRGDDHAVGRVGGEEGAVDVDLEPHQASGVHLLEHGFVEREPTTLRRAYRLDRDLEHHALGDLVVARDETVERVLEVGGLDLGEVAHLPHVHAEHGDARLVGGVDRAQHGAVAAERDHDVEVGRVEIGAALALRDAHLDVVGAEAGRRLGHELRGLLAIGVRHEADAADAHAPGNASSRRSSSSAGPRASQRTRNSTLPSAPFSGDAITSSTWRPASRRPSRTSCSTARCTAGSRTTPPLPMRARPASNCGFTSSTRSPSGAVQRASAGATVTSEMNERSATVRSTAPPRSLGSRWRTLARSRTVTRGSSRSDQASWPRPTSTASTCTAPAWRRQSVKPPVEAPASRARRPRASTSKRSSAAASFSPPRDTKRGGSPVIWMGSSAATSRVGAGAGLPPTRTRPAAIASTAWRRLPSIPRRTSSASSRRRTVTGAEYATSLPPSLASARSVPAIGRRRTRTPDRTPPVS